MGRALLICANADGQLPPAEREWILGYMASKGAPTALLDELAAFDATGDVLALLPKSDAVNKSRRVLIYDAIRACSSDGEFHADERAAVVRMAEALGVTADVVDQLEAAVRADQEVTEQRIKLVYPDGAPF
jgi:tellurite resistance protein